MTLKYPKKTAVGQKRKGSITAANTTNIQYSPSSSSNSSTSSTSTSSSWMSPPAPVHQQYEYTTTPHHQFIDVSPQYSASQETLYYPEYNKSPLIHAQQLSPPLTTTATTNHHLQSHPMSESCDWAAPTNHRQSNKPVATNTYATASSSASVTGNGQDEIVTHQWTTEFTYIDATATSSKTSSTTTTTDGVELIPEFINFCEYEQQTGFPPSVISSTASTLSSPTTSTDYNFTYPFETNLNSSMSNDGFDAVYQQNQQHQGMDTIVYGGGGYEAAGMYAGEGVYQSPQSEIMSTGHWTADISNIPYEPNYYPFASGTEKMMTVY